MPESASGGLADSFLKHRPQRLALAYPQRVTGFSLLGLALDLLIEIRKFVRVPIHVGLEALELLIGSPCRGWGRSQPDAIERALGGAIGAGR
jgi:hypothetical protein